MDKMLESVLKRLRPLKQEERKLRGAAKEIMRNIRIHDAVPELGGSFAKGTWLRGNHDIDIYVKFERREYRERDISEILYHELQNKFKKIETLHGSRDYYRLKFKGLVVEIIPILSISKAEEAANITDISPLHVEWVMEHGEKTDEIRLAKAFCKAGNVYGAESYIQGFSGYTLEILTIHFGSFNALMEHAAKWNINAKTIIDAEKYFEGKDILGELNISKAVSPLILIDPVQKERNAAAGIGVETFSRFIGLAKSYLAKPSPKFFSGKKMTIALLKKKAAGNKLLASEIVPLEGKKDVIGAKLLKCLKFIKSGLESNGFELIDFGWQWDRKALFWFIVPDKNLSRLARHDGPPVKVVKSAMHFREVWEGVKVLEENGFLYVMKPRAYTNTEKLFNALIKKDYIVERISSIKVIK